MLGDRHRASQGHYHEAVFVTRHRLQHVGAFTYLPAGKRGIPHRPHQGVDGVDF
jgi:hypothetical protein